MAKPKQSPGLMLKQAFTGMGLKIFLSYILIIELIVLSRGYGLKTVGVCLLCAVPLYMILALITGYAREKRSHPGGDEEAVRSRDDADSSRNGDPVRKS